MDIFLLCSKNSNGHRNLWKWFFSLVWNILGFHKIHQGHLFSDYIQYFLLVFFLCIKSTFIHHSAANEALNIFCKLSLSYSKQVAHLQNLNIEDIGNLFQFLHYFLQQFLNLKWIYFFLVQVLFLFGIFKIVFYLPHRMKMEYTNFFPFIMLNFILL